LIVKRYAEISARTSASLQLKMEDSGNERAFGCSLQPASCTIKAFYESIYGHGVRRICK
jgi:hypothetical protein